MRVQRGVQCALWTLVGVVALSVSALWWVATVDAVPGGGPWKESGGPYCDWPRICVEWELNPGAKAYCCMEMDEIGNPSYTACGSSFRHDH